MKLDGNISYESSIIIIAEDGHLTAHAGTKSGRHLTAHVGTKSGQHLTAHVGTKSRRNPTNYEQKIKNGK